MLSIKKSLSTLGRLLSYGVLLSLAWSENIGWATVVVPVLAGAASPPWLVLFGVLAWLGVYCLFAGWGGRGQAPRRCTDEAELVRFLMTHADLGYGSGIVYLTADSNILALSRLPLRLAYEHRPQVDPTGLPLQEAFAPRLAEFFLRLQQQARLSRQPVAADIVEWTGYSAEAHGAVRVTASPAYGPGGYWGALLVFRNQGEVKHLQQVLQQSQQDYQVLFDGLPYAAAVFRPISGVVPGTTESLLLECNTPFRQLFEGLYEPPVTLVEFLRSHFIRVPQLRDAMAQLLTQGGRVRIEYFSTVVGRHLEVILAQLPRNRVLVLTLDHTEQQLYAEQVLQLNDQLRLTISREQARLAALTEERDRFIEAVSDQVCVIAEGITTPQGSGQPEAQALQRVASQLMHYASVASLPFGQSELIATRELLPRLLAPRKTQRTDLDWELGALPAMMGSPAVLTQVLQRLFDVLEQLPRLESVKKARIRVTSWSQFLTSGLSLVAVGLDGSDLLLEVPDTPQPLDWTLSSDLELSIVRRMLITHGGSLVVGAQAEGFAIRFSLGTPT